MCVTKDRLPGETQAEYNVAAGRIAGNAKSLLMDAEYNYWQSLTPDDRLEKYKAQDVEGHGDALTLFYAIRQAYAECRGWEY